MKIIIADDHDLVRDAISTLIKRDDHNADIMVASNFDQAYEILSNNPDTNLVLLDVYMPGMCNLESIKKMITDFPETPVVMISGLIKHNDVKKSFAYGARGFIPKTMNGKALVSVLKMIISGAKYIPDIVLKSKINDSELNSFGLSKREEQVLKLLFQGLPNKVISQKLFIEETTVKLHLRALFKKFVAKNRTDLVIKAIKAGYSDE
ncbi:MAG: response regulator transcription factor [Alcanivoracaceae bacterium]|nr:response regulator transcription factor [Alcanivoracaceae bacterium]